MSGTQKREAKVIREGKIREGKSELICIVYLRHDSYCDLNTLYSELVQR